MRLKKLSYLLLIFLNILCLSAQTIRKDIVWQGIKQISDEDKSIFFLNFENALLDVDNFYLPTYTDLIEVNQHNFEVTVVNFSYTKEPLSRDEIGFINDEMTIGFEPNLQIGELKSGNQSFIKILFVPLVYQNQQYYKITNFSLNYTLNTKPTLQSPNTSFNYQIINGVWHKLGVINRGIHKISFEDLVSWKIIQQPIQSNLIALVGNKGGMNSYLNSLPRPDSLAKVPIHIMDGGDGEFGENDYFIFYAEDAKNIQYSASSKKFNVELNDFTDTNFVFLGLDATFQKIMEIEEFEILENSIILNTGHDFYHHQNQLLNFIKSGRQWVGEDLLSVNPRIFNMKLSDLITTTPVKIDYSAGVRSNLGVGSNLMELYINDVLVRTIAYPAVSPIYYNDYVRFNDQSFNVIFPNEQISFKNKYAQPNNTSAAWIHKFTFNYAKKWVYRDEPLWITNVDFYGNNNNFLYQIQALNPKDLLVFEVNDFYQTKKVEVEQFEDKLEFYQYSNNNNQYILLHPSQCFSVLYKAPIEFANFRENFTKPELLIIAHPEFLNAAEEIKKIHENEDNMITKVVNVEDIYNEFSSGRKEAPAIRDFIRHIYLKPQDIDLKYVLLFGDGSHDAKRINSTHINHIPVFQSENSTRLTGSYGTDDFYALMDINEGNFGPFDQLDISVGRIPVKNQSEANNAVFKIKEYYGLTQDSKLIRDKDWRNKIHFIADDGDGFEHMRQAEQLTVLVDTTIQNLNISKTYIDAFPKIKTITKNQVIGAEEKIQNMFKNGGLLINYTGHGGEYGWASERILTNLEIMQMRNLFSYPLVMTATCEFSRFDDPKQTSAGENLFLQHLGGAIALFTTTRLVFSIPNFRLNRSFYEVLAEKKQDDVIRLGDLFKETKVKNNGGNNDRNFTLLGDPAIRFSFPSQKVKTQNILVNEIIVDTIKALNTVRIIGEIEDENSYNGWIEASVYDKKVNRTSLDNDRTGENFNYVQQENMLSKSIAEVKNGKFDIQFKLPKNTRSDFGIGKITYLVFGNEKTFSGFKNITIGGLDSNALNDKLGPEIEIWLNDSTYTFGSAIQPQPILIAKLKDDSGINLTSDEIGTNIILKLNGNSNNEKILNPFYTPATNDFTKGTVRLQLNDVKEGRYTLVVKASDNLNNPSEALTEFYIAETAPLAIKNLINYPNPFTTQTGFYFEHNNPQNEMDAMIRIYTISGRLIKTLRYQTVTDSNRVGPIDWDGRDDFGDPIGRGVYFYKLTVKMGDQNLEETNKLVILK
jgi:hypothetical protein